MKKGTSWDVPQSISCLHIPVDSFQHIQNVFLGELAAVNTEVIVSHIQPLCVCKIFVVRTSPFIHFLYQGAGAALLPAYPFHDIFYPALKGGENENAFASALQNLVRTASRDDTVSFFCQVMDDFRLGFKSTSFIG